MKSNMAYRRFRHFGKDKVTMDFAFFAIAFNIKKMCAVMAKHAPKGGNTPSLGPFMRVSLILSTAKRHYLEIPQKSAA